MKRNEALAQETDVMAAITEATAELDILRQLRVLNYCAQRVADEINMQQAMLAQQRGGNVQPAGRPAPRLVRGPSAPNRDGSG